MDGQRNMVSDCECVGVNCSRHSEANVAALEAANAKLLEALTDLGKTRGCPTCALPDDACDRRGEPTRHTTCKKLNAIGKRARAALQDADAIKGEKP